MNTLNFGNKVKELREKSKLSQEQFAKRMGYQNPVYLIMSYTYDFPDQMFWQVYLKHFM